MSDFFKFQSTRPPVITQQDLPEVIKLLGTFDEVTFNDRAELIAVSRIPLYHIGEVTVSFYVREQHFFLTSKAHEGTDKFYSGYLHENFDLPRDDEDTLFLPTKEALKDWTRAKVLEVIQKALSVL
jgi:hypothetical protein